MLKLIKKTDLFGYQVRFQFNKKHATFNTVAGGMCSIFLYIIMCTYLMFNAEDLFNKFDNA